jgi:hypothetical protein
MYENRNARGHSLNDEQELGDIEEGGATPIAETVPRGCDAFGDQRGLRRRASSGRRAGVERASSGRRAGVGLEEARASVAAEGLGAG